MQQDERKYSPGHAARCILLAPGATAPNQVQPQGADSESQWHTQFNGEMQGQVVGVVQDLAESRPVVLRQEMGVVQLPPTPTPPRFLCDQVQYVAPQDPSASAGNPLSLKSTGNAIPEWIEAQQIREHEHRNRVGGHSGAEHRPDCALAGACPHQGERHQQRQLHGTGARRRGSVPQREQCGHRQGQPTRRTPIRTGLLRCSQGATCKGHRPPQQDAQPQVGECGKLVALT